MHINSVKLPASECSLQRYYFHFRLVQFLEGSIDSGQHGALRPQKPLRLIRDGEVGGLGNFISNTYFLHCQHQNDSALRWTVV